MRRTLSLRQRFVLALAIPVLAALVLAIVAYGSAQRSNTLLAQAEMAIAQLKQIEGLDADMNRGIVAALLSPNPLEAMEGLGQLERDAMRRLGILEERLESATINGPTVDLEGLTASALATIEAAEALVRLRASADLAAPVNDRFAALSAAQAQFTDDIEVAVTTELDFITSTQSEIAQLRIWLRRASVGIPIFALIAVMGIGIPLALTVSKRVSTFSAGVSRIAQGALDHRVPVGSADELGQLAGDLNRMAEMLERDSDRKADTKDKLEAEIKRRSAELELTNARLSEIDATRRRFLGDIGHALKTPLAIAKGSLGLAERRLTEDPSDLDALHKAIAAVDTVATEVTTLLELARSEDGTLSRVKKPVELFELLDRKVTNFSRLPTQPQISLDYTGMDPLVIDGDATELSRMLDAVLENALRYAPEGSVTQLNLRRDGSNAVIDVRDQGPGIEAENPDHIFDRFVKSKDGGTGIGLAIARRVAEDHGGTINVADTSPQGTTISIRLPRTTG